MKATQLKCPACGSIDLEKLKWNEYRCSHCGSMLKLDSERERLELAVWACPECGFGNAVGQRFCSQCGAKLTKACPRCRTENYLDVRYCGSCGFAFKLWKVYSHLEAKLASLRQRLAGLKARQAKWPLTERLYDPSIAKLVQEIEELEEIKTGPPSWLEEWIREQERVAEEKRRAAEERRRAGEERKRRRVEEKRKAAEERRRQFADLKRQMQQFTQGRLDKIIILASVLLLLCCLCSLAGQVVSHPMPKATPTLAPTATPAPTNTPARPTRPTSTPPAETILGESIRKQIYLEWVEAQNSKAGDEDVWQEIARRWGITVGAVEDIVVEGLNKKWPQSAATPTLIPLPPTQPTMDVIPTLAPATLPTGCDTVTEIPQAECRALVALYNSTDGANWSHNDGWLDTNTPCSWYGVKCEAHHVTELNMLNNHVHGTIPPDLDNLTELRVLDFWGNHLVGNIPRELGNLRKLQTFRVYGNVLTGSIPPELGNLIYLEILVLSTNRLSGSIPPELGKLVNLRELHLHSNRLSGGVSSELGNLVNLRKLHIANNQLSGALPKTLMKLTKLSAFNYGGTNLCAPADAAFQNWLAGISDLQTSGLICP